MESEVPLLARENQISSERVTFWRELRKVSYIALPMVIVSVTQYLLRAVSMMLLGHLGELELSGASIATSLTNVTGFSVIFGMASALETLCGQAYGAENYQKVGTYCYGAVIWLSVSCLPICILWVYTDQLLILLGQDPEISMEAGKFSVWLIPSLFPNVILQCMVRFLQIQSLIYPMVISTIATLIIHFPLSWALIFTLELGTAGAALSIGISYSLNAIFLGLYVFFASSCKKTRSSFSKDVLLTVGEFFKFAVPSALMVCLEWWTFEIIVLLGGLLPNPQLETSGLAICLTISSVHYLIPYSFGAAASTRVSNELGAGKPRAARQVVFSVMALAIVEFTVGNIVIYLCRSVLGYAFSNEKEVVDYIRDMIPILVFSVVTDSIQAVLSGVARGSGWQHIGAFVNLGTYYLIGIPLSLLLGFVLRWKGKGLWSGLVAGSTAQSFTFILITCFMDWEKQALQARLRILDKIPADDSSI